MKRVISILLAALMIAGVVSGCSAASSSTSSAAASTSASTASSSTASKSSSTRILSSPISKVGVYFDTQVQLSIYDDLSNTNEILDKCLSLCEYYENLISRTKEGTEIYELNAKGTLTVSDDTLEMIKDGLYYCELSNGVLDISVAPLSALWNFTADDPKVPDQADIDAAKAKIDYTKIKIDGNTVTLEEGMGIDLGAIAKGYIADKLAALLEENGVGHAIISLGGNILCVGDKGGKDFTVGIQSPFDDTSLLSVKINGKSVVTSGVYQRGFEEDGVWYHHILDVETGYPYSNGVASVTIISDKSVDGDCLSTTCFALGKDKGLELINSMDGIEGVYIMEDGTIYPSNGMESTYSMNKLK